MRQATKISLLLIFASMIFMEVSIQLLGDELHKKNGEILYGRLEKDTGSSLKFKEAGKNSAKSFRKKDIQRLVLTYSLPDFVINNPRWSKEMIEARQKKAFDPSWGDVEILKSDHYIVFTNSSAGKRYLATMEDIYTKFKKAFAFEEPPKAILMPVFLFKTNDHYYKYYANIANISIMAAKASGGHAWRDYYATYYQAPKDPVHYHEGAHQLVKLRLGVSGGGSWFQEGLAVYFEGLVFKAEDPSIGMKSEVRNNRHTHLSEMIRLRSLLHSSGSSQLAMRRYRQSGALIKFFLEGPDKELFPKMVDAVKAGESWDQIFKEVYGRTIDEMDEAFVEFYRNYRR